jgi:hypothetical protein
MAMSTALNTSVTTALLTQAQDITTAFSRPQMMSADYV